MAERAALYLSLGSNLGDRERNILEAVERMDLVFGKHDRLSQIIETPSWGFEAEPFLNAAVRYMLEIAPEENLREKAYGILEEIKGIERALGRADTAEYDSAGARIYHSRTIDIDILLFSDLSMDEPQLTIPHRLMDQRDFVKIPLSEIID